MHRLVFCPFVLPWDPGPSSRAEKGTKHMTAGRYCMAVRCGWFAVTCDPFYMLPGALSDCFSFQICFSWDT